MKNKKLLNAISLMALPVFLFLALGSSEPRKANVENINEDKNLLLTDLSSIKPNMKKTTEKISAAYGVLNNLTKGEKNIGDNELLQLENQLQQLQTSYSALKQSHRSAERRGTNYFEMLRRRAEENQTKSLKDRLLEEIHPKEKSFLSNITKIGEALSTMEKPIQKFDDIVGFYQVSKGLKDSDLATEPISSVIEKSKSLDAEVREYVDMSLDIIKDL
ncbi:MAG: hypothetical protein MK183_01135 [Verrucomicrobiales bacterium]|nr:hypothetical protein [Verrucomicrobiales bacterium]